MPYAAPMPPAGQTQSTTTSVSVYLISIMSVEYCVT